MEEVYFDVCCMGWLKDFIVEMFIFFMFDDSFVLAGQYVVSFFCQYVVLDLLDGVLWDDYCEEVVDLMIEMVDKWLFGFKVFVLGCQIYSLLDFECKFGLIGGDIFYGVFSFDQFFLV